MCSQSLHFFVEVCEIMKFFFSYSSLNATFKIGRYFRKFDICTLRELYDRLSTFTLAVLPLGFVFFVCLSKLIEKIVLFIIDFLGSLLNWNFVYLFYFYSDVLIVIFFWCIFFSSYLVIN